jgi:Zn-dependent protease
MSWSWNLGRLFGIDTRVHASFLLVLLWAGWSSYSSAGTLFAAVAGVVFMVAVFASVVAHELGHALTARAYGIETRQILLLPIGGVAQLEQAHMRPRVELRVALAGPVVSFLLAGVLFTFAAIGGDVSPDTFLGSLAWTNLGLAVFNMLPAFPMDGGRVLRAALAGRIGHLRATRIAATIGTVGAVLFAALGLYTGRFMLMLMAAFLYFAARSESRVMPHPGPRRGHSLLREDDPVLLRDGDDPRDLYVVRSPRGRIWLFRN